MHVCVRVCACVYLCEREERERERERQQRLMRIRRVVSHAIQPMPSPPKTSHSTSNPPFISPIITVVVDKVYFVIVILFKLFIAWQCSLAASWCTLCVGMLKFGRGVMVY